MRYLVLSDLHGNREALQAVVSEAEGQYDRIVCCGDLAGYGPDPNYVVEWAREHCDAVIRGNHDRGCTGLTDLEWFNPVAREACVWTASRLTQANFQYLHALPAGPMAVGDFELVHGSPLDEDEYLLSLADARPVFAALNVNLVFFGHTHVQCAFTWMHGQYSVTGLLDPGESRRELYIAADAAWLVNPGAVGQPRDGDPRASWLLFDSDSRRLTQCRTDYDSAVTGRKIRAAGLPEILAARLRAGR